MEFNFQPKPLHEDGGVAIGQSRVVRKTKTSRQLEFMIVLTLINAIFVGIIVALFLPILMK